MSRVQRRGSLDPAVGIVGRVRVLFLDVQLVGCDAHHGPYSALRQPEMSSAGLEEMRWLP